MARSKRRKRGEQATTAEGLEAMLAEPGDRSGPEAGGGEPRLTPVDIQQKEFRLAFRGYSEQDVDAFLDEITAEMARLHEENKRLTEALTEGGGGSLGGQTVEDAQRRAEEIVREARERAAQLVEETQGASAPGATPFSAVRPFLSREREFLQGLAAMIQSHAEAVKDDARRVREPEAAPAAPAPPPPPFPPLAPLGPRPSTPSSLLGPPPSALTPSESPSPLGEAREPGERWHNPFLSDLTSARTETLPAPPDEPATGEPEETSEGSSAPDEGSPGEAGQAAPTGEGGEAASVAEAPAPVAEPPTSAPREDAEAASGMGEGQPEETPEGESSPSTAGERSTADVPSTPEMPSPAEDEEPPSPPEPMPGTAADLGEPSGPGETMPAPPAERTPPSVPGRSDAPPPPDDPWRRPPGSAQGAGGPVSAAGAPDETDLELPPRAGSGPPPSAAEQDRPSAHTTPDAEDRSLRELFWGEE